MVVCGHRLLLCHFTTATQKHPCVCLSGAERGEQVCLSAADVSVAGVMTSRVAGVVSLMLVDVWTDVGVALMCAVRTVGVRAVHTARVSTGGDVEGVLPVASTGGSGGPAGQAAALSPAAGLEAGVQLYARPVALRVRV